MRDREANSDGEHHGQPGRGVSEGSPSFLGFAIGIVIALAYFSLFAQFAVNVPYWDDYFLMRGGPLSDCLSADWLFQLHNEHRITFTKAVSGLIRALTGHYDFKWLGVVGNLLLIPLVIVILNTVRVRTLSAPTVVAVCVLIFAPQSWESMTWATSSTQNYGVMLFASLSMSAYFSTSRHSVALFSICSTAAALTSASGLLVFPVVLFLSAARRLRRNDQVGVTKICAAMIVGSAMWTTHLAGQASGLDLQATSFSSLFDATLRFPVVLGSYLNLEPFIGIGPIANIAALLLGVAVLAFGVRAAISNFDGDTALVGIFLFVSSSALLIAIARHDFGVRQAMSSRYCIHSSVAICTVLLLYRDHRGRLGGRFAGLQVAALVALFCASAVVYSGSMASRKHALLTGIHRWQDGQPSGLQHGENMQGDAILRKAIANDLYQISVDRE